VRGLSEAFPVPEGARVSIWLPAAHVIERVFHYLLPMAAGWTVTICPDPREIAAYVRAAHPDAFIAVPSVWK
jgi:long-subunit acyl-CoA synthetase (AMP-forming)